MHSARTGFATRYWAQRVSLRRSGGVALTRLRAPGSFEKQDAGRPIVTFAPIRLDLTVCVVLAAYSVGASERAEETNQGLQPPIGILGGGPVAEQVLGAPWDHPNPVGETDRTKPFGRFAPHAGRRAR